MPRILLLASDASVVHTRRWGEWFHDSGWEVVIASFVDAAVPGAEVHVLEGGTRSALARARAARHLRRLARAVEPNVVNAHYLTTYGAIAAKAGVEPLVVTAWGPDVLTEPATSPTCSPPPEWPSAGHKPSRPSPHTWRMPSSPSAPAGRR